MSFARVVAVDFSAASSPTTGADSLWTAHCEADGPIRTRNHATREQLTAHLDDLVARAGRTLIVIDVALGWPVGMASALGVRGRSGVVALLNELVSDEANNANNRFAVASELNRRAGAALLWGHPRSQRYDHLAMTTRAPEGLAPRPFSAKRTIEHHVGGVIKSPVQLCGVGAVGSQSVLAQVLFERMRSRGLDLSVWPFEPATTRVVVAEYFFSLLAWRAEVGRVTDERQVRSAARWARAALRDGDALDASALLGALSARERRDVLSEEGWLMGWPSTTR